MINGGVEDAVPLFVQQRRVGCLCRRQRQHCVKHTVTHTKCTCNQCLNVILLLMLLVLVLVLLLLVASASRKDEVRLEVAGKLRVGGLR